MIVDFSVFPDSVFASVVEVTPVNWLPLPMNNPVETTFPTALTTLATVVPVTLTPVLVTTTTLATPALLMLITPSSKMAILLDPLAIPVIPPILNSSVKLSLVLMNAVRNGSPSPSLATLPTLITCCTIF